MKKKVLIGSSAIILVIIAFVIVAITSGPWHNTVKDLEGIEVREYEGRDLSSINDFRENSISGPQYVATDSYRLEITGLVSAQRSYTYDEILSAFEKYRKVVRLNCVEGWAVDILWEGILVKDILQQTGPLDSARIAIFHAYDGYATSFPLEYLMDNNIIMAYKMNDVTLPPERGYPFQLVAESKWGYKWIKWITRIVLSDDISYRGYWESRGYSNEADLDKGFLGP